MDHYGKLALIELQHMLQFAARSPQPELRSSPKTASSSLLKIHLEVTPPPQREADALDGGMPFPEY